MTAMAPFPTRYAANGMVCSIDHLASSAGVAMLRAGGNAVDAAIAANAVLAVTSQHLCGLGGDLFALVHVPGEAEPAVLNASGRAGSGADPERVRASGHRRMPLQGHVGAVTVPGCVDGWTALHARFASLALADLLEPARRLAAGGFPVSPTLAVSARALERLAPGEVPDFPRGAALRAGAVMRRPGVARALESIARDGRAGFYEGAFGEGLLAVGGGEGGEFTAADLAAPQAEWVGGLALDAWGRRLWTVPPNSQGYLTLAGAALAGSLPLPRDPAADLWPHLLVEAAAAAGSDRPAVLHERADGLRLLAPERLAAQRATIGLERAGAAAGVPASATGHLGDTAYLCAADGSGLGVSLIQSNYTGFGSMLVVPGLGVFLHNRGAGFSLEAGHPAEYGPRRRPPHTLAPALVTTTGGDLECLVGTMGGDSQPQILLQLLARRLAAGLEPADCVAAPRWVLTAAAAGGPGGTTATGVWDPGAEVAVAVEGHAPAAWFEGLARRGHRVVRAPAWEGRFGHAH
ncbi:MAG TPA: gamma-glutamyltransferase, partial [Acidimicrobiales bacterium]|nr:gamma-glutamyltransferase [Acidimicrobiales bacterium]